MALNKASIKKQIKLFFKPIFYILKDIVSFREKVLLKQNIQFKDRYKDQRCFLLLTGASIDDIDLTTLRNEQTMTLNLVGLHKRIKDIDLKMYFLPINGKKINKTRSFETDYVQPVYAEYRDQNYLRNYQYVINNNPERAKNIFEVADKSLSEGGMVFSETANKGYFSKYSLFKNKQVVYYSLRDVLTGMNVGTDNGNMDLDLTKRFPGSSNTMINCIFLLIYFGFKEIYLCGAGYTFDPKYEFHFYDSYLIPKNKGFTEAERIAKEMVSVYNTANHAGIKYHGLKEEENHYRVIYVSNYEQTEDAHRIHTLANDYARSKGVKIFNIVPDTFQSPVYEKVIWENVKEKLSKV